MKVAYSQTGGAYGDAVISAMVTIAIRGPHSERIIQAFENSGYNFVKQYAYNTWFDLLHVTGLSTSMAVVKVTEWFDYRYLTEANLGPGSVLTRIH